MAHIKDKKITILRKISVPDGRGGSETTWEPLPGGENIWAYYRQTTGSEFYEAARANIREEAVFEINWRNDIKAPMRILFRGKKYEITRVDDFEGYKQDQKIYAYTLD